MAQLHRSRTPRARSLLTVFILLSSHLVCNFANAARPPASSASTQPSPATPSSGIDGCCCDIQTIDQGNPSLHRVLTELRNTTFFKIFKVDLYRECQFWKEAPMCTMNRCGVCECDDHEVPKQWRKEDEQLYFQVDKTIGDTAFAPWDEHNNQWVPFEPNGVYINLQRNPLGYTGYQGPDAAKIWRAIYEENCFVSGSRVNSASELFDESKGDGVCTEQRVFYRLISGFQATITAHLTAHFPNKDGTLGPNITLYERLLGRFPDRVQNVYFTYVFLLRAVNKAASILRSYDYRIEGESLKTTRLVSDMLDSGLVGHCSPEQSFDESALFRDLGLKAQFKQTFKNISRIIDCVSCEQCRLHAKMGIFGLGTALKILFFDGELKDLELQRNEIIALVNALGVFADSVYSIRDMETMLAQERARTNAAFGVSSDVLSVACALVVSVACVAGAYRVWLWRERRNRMRTWTTIEGSQSQIKKEERKRGSSGSAKVRSASRSSKKAE